MTMPNRRKYLQLHSMHGLIRGEAPELGADADTGGQVLYVLELAKALGKHPEVERVELVTRLLRDPAVGPDYAVAVEPLSDNVSIVRIPCGGDTYLRKEELWPFIDEYVENVAAHIRASGRMPDLFHSHYADAGAVCTRLSRLFGVPQVHTGHSLGRAKRRQLLVSGEEPAILESRFRLSRRIAEEERTFRHASLIVASTHQERRAQYGEYEADTLGKIQVIPPGINVSKFFPYYEGRSPQVIDMMNAEFNRFLKNNDKPPILAISRPVRKKNLAALVQAYGEDAELQEMANLVIFAGTREDIAHLPDNEREVLTELLILMDKYDLYGKMALPKSHEFETDVPALYRMAARKGGIFVNPALTEPFGLTLLEAAASGLPLVATNDGGPPDIVGACRNGIVVPPTDTGAIARAMKAILQDSDKWHVMSSAGIRGVRAHYTWEAHVEAYMALVDQLLTSGEVEEAIEEAQPAHKLLVTDIDDVLTGDAEATERFGSWLSTHRDRVRLVITSGRSIVSIKRLIDAGTLPVPDMVLASVGTEIYRLPGYHHVDAWEERIRAGWDRSRVRQLLDGFAPLLAQEAIAQTRYKLSYYVNTDEPTALLEEIAHRLSQHGLQAQLVFSNENLLDVIPAGASKGRALAWLCERLGLAPEDVLACGDSVDDLDMLSQPSFAVVPAGSRPEVMVLGGQDRVYFAASAYADALLEGIAHYGFLSEAPTQEETA